MAAQINVRTTAVRPASARGRPRHARPRPIYRRKKLTAPDREVDHGLTATCARTIFTPAFFPSRDVTRERSMLSAHTKFRSRRRWRARAFETCDLPRYVTRRGGGIHAGKRRWMQRRSATCDLPLAGVPHPAHRHGPGFAADAVRVAASGDVRQPRLAADMHDPQVAALERQVRVVDDRQHVVDAGLPPAAGWSVLVERHPAHGAVRSGGYQAVSQPLPRAGGPRVRHSAPSVPGGKNRRV